jgi:hypothetical protein
MHSALVFSFWYSDLVLWLGYHSGVIGEKRTEINGAFLAIVFEYNDNTKTQNHRIAFLP